MESCSAGTEDRERDLMRKCEGGLGEGEGERERDKEKERKKKREGGRRREKK